MKQIYVVHDDGDDLGLRPVPFPTEDQARGARDAWNKEIPGHRVVVVDESLEPNAPADQTATAGKVRRDVGFELGLKH